MSRALAKLLLVVTSILMVILCTVFVNNQNTTAATIVAAVGIVVMFILNHALRCPHCGRWPGRGNFFAEYCPGCGEKLDD